jgi:hypothetical protein
MFLLVCDQVVFRLLALYAGYLIEFIIIQRLCFHTIVQDRQSESRMVLQTFWRIRASNSGLGVIKWFYQKHINVCGINPPVKSHCIKNTNALVGFPLILS